MRESSVQQFIVVILIQGKLRNRSMSFGDKRNVIKFESFVRIENSDALF